MSAKTRPTLPDACIFDLDGTLVNSLRDIAEAANSCLKLLGLRGHPIDNYRYLVGEGVPKLCERAIGRTHPHLTKRLTELVRAFYRLGPLKHTRPYPGLVGLVERLRSANVPLGVLSNKPHDMTQRVVCAFWGDSVFACIQGYTDDARRKPDPHHLLRICEQLDVDPRRIWLVGDTPTDVETARRAGAVSVGVTWGFRSRDDLAAAGADIIFDRPEDLA